MVQIRRKRKSYTHKKIIGTCCFGLILGIYVFNFTTFTNLQEQASELTDHFFGIDDEILGLHGESNATESAMPMLKLPEHCQSSNNIKEIVIKGERHTGTNWIRSIISKNIQKDIIIDQDSRIFGWKHGFLPPLGWGKPLSSNEVLVVVTRDVFTWLPKMMQTAYDPIMNNKIKRLRKFSKYIRAKYGALCHPLEKKRDANQSEYQTKFCAKYQTKRFGRFGRLKQMPSETADNLISIRTQKYKQWLDDDPNQEAFVGSKEGFRQNRIHVRLEALISGTSEPNNDKDLQHQFIGEQLLQSCVPVSKNFQSVITHTKWQGKKTKGEKQGVKFDASKERRKMLRRYSKDDLRFVLDQLDIEFEKKLGYNYDYVYEMLEDDTR